jgi:hypothetical protein
MGDPHGLQLDDRLERLNGSWHDKGKQPCTRPFTEFILDCFGNHHPCCYDWRGEASLGNVHVDGFTALVERWKLFQDAVCGAEMSDDAPAACRACGRRPPCGVIDRESVIRAMRWRQKLIQDARPSESA